MSHLPVQGACKPRPTNSSTSWYPLQHRRTQSGTLRPIPEAPCSAGFVRSRIEQINRCGSFRSSHSLTCGCRDRSRKHSVVWPPKEPPKSPPTQSPSANRN